MFEKLSGYQYKSYEGVAMESTQDGPILVHHSGRIIVDTSSWNRQPDQCTVYVEPLVKSDSDNTTDDEKLGLDKDEQNGEMSTKSVSSSTILTDYQRLLCTPILRGYSLRSKKWLSFFVDSVSDIDWNTQAFDGLVLPEDQKQLILALSKCQAASMKIFDDVIQGKGKGMIILLSGPPGVGKTLTAEAVSENMQVPLYMMSAGDLGIRPDQVEFKLEGILSMVARWNAILLIDECDVFLEERSIHDLERNKLVSIFLRLLEYYQGTLFLTTNRSENIDSAFQSRIHVHMAYPDLTVDSRRSIWDNFLRKIKVPTNFSKADLDELAEVDINGRQIKNLIKTAFLIAMEMQRPLCKSHIDTVLAIEKGKRIGKNRKITS